MEVETVISQVEQKPSIKITHNSKGYNWEIRLIGADMEVIEKLEKLNDEMKMRFKDESGD